MLTKSDLSQIREIVREEVEAEVQSARDELQAEIKLVRMELSTHIDKLEDRIKNLEIRVARMHKELKNEIKLVVNFLDRENIKTLKRVIRIEDHLGLMSA